MLSNVFDHHLDNSTSQNELLKLIESLNIQKNVNGILVQLPLPDHINEQLILDSINPDYFLIQVHYKYWVI